VTALATLPAVEAEAPAKGRVSDPRTVIEHLAVAAVLLWWALPLTRGTGGREPHVVSVGVVLVLAGLAATRVWQRLRTLELMAAATVLVAALVVCLTSPVGWAGANDLGSWSFATGVFLMCRAYIRSRERALALIAAVALAGLLQFSDGWLAWWGGSDPSRPMLGTFYWHNQYAAFLLVPALLGVALSAWPRRPVTVLGWVVAPLCSAGVLFSTSRATIGLLVGGWVLLLALAAWMPGRRSAVVRLLMVAALTVGTAFALTGPPFFSHRAAPSSALAKRSESQSASGDASYRTITWRQAVTVYREHPVTGTGFHGFASAAAAATPGQRHSAFAHDAWLQAFSDGGTVLGLPFLLASLAVALALVRRLVARVRRRTEPALVVAGVAALLLAAHSLVDFDTSYPALFAALAVATATGLTPLSGPTGITPARRRLLPVALVTVVAAVALVAVGPAWHGSLQLNLDLTGGARVTNGSH
jgi:O-antigen ligase